MAVARTFSLAAEAGPRGTPSVGHSLLLPIALTDAAGMSVPDASAMWFLLFFQGGVLLADRSRVVAGRG